LLSFLYNYVTTCFCFFLFCGDGDGDGCGDGGNAAFAASSSFFLFFSILLSNCFSYSFDRDMLLDAVLLILKSLGLEGSKIGVKADVDINSGAVISNKTNEWSDLSVFDFPLVLVLIKI
jgi:hypothetical protein